MRLAALFLIAAGMVPGQTNGSAIPFVKPVYFTNGGLPASGYKVCFYAAGTTTPQLTFTTSGLGIPNPNPVVLDISGRADIFLAAQSYKVALLLPLSTTADCITGTMSAVWTEDNIANNADLLRVALQGPGGAGLIGFQPTGGTVPTTAAIALNATLLDVGYSTLALACSAASAQGKTLTVTKAWTAVPAGTLNCNEVFVGGGSIQPLSANTVTLAGTITAPPLQIFDYSLGGSIAFSLPAPMTLPQWWGAIANGTGVGGVSQTVAFQSAVTALPAAGGTIYIPDAPLAYTIGYPGIVLPGNVTVECQSRNTVLQVQAGAFSSWPTGWAVLGNGGSIPSLTPISNAHIKNCTIDGNRANITGLSNANISALGFAFFGCSNCSADNVYVKNAGDGGYIDCANLTTHGVNFTITDFTFVNNQRNNISWICGTNLTLSNGFLLNANGAAPEAGIDVEPNVPGGGPNGLISFSGVHADNNGGSGFLLQPNYDANSLSVQMDNTNEASGNGATPQTYANSGIFWVDNAGGNSFTLTGGSYHDNYPSQISLQGTGIVNLSGEVLGGAGALGVYMAGQQTVTLGPGYVTGTSYDFEVDTFTNCRAAGVYPAHFNINGMCLGLFSSAPITQNTSSFLSLLIAQTNVAAGVTSANNNDLEFRDGTVGYGVANTVGTAVTWLYGLNFAGLKIGNTLTIGTGGSATSCIVATIPDATDLTCTLTQGSQPNAEWIVTGTTPGAMTAQRFAYCDDLKSGLYNNCVQSAINAAAGTVNTVNAGGNTTVTWATGPYFNFLWTGTFYLDVGGTVTGYPIASVNSPTSITLTGNAGTNSGAGWAIPGFNWAMQATGTASTLLTGGFDNPAWHFAALVKAFPCGVSTYGHSQLIDDAASTVINSNITGGGTHGGTAVCTSESGTYTYH